jgi:hypothetical protein
MIYRAGVAFRLRFGSGHSSARQRDKSRATSVTTQFLEEILTELRRRPLADLAAAEVGATKCAGDKLPA